MKKNHIVLLIGVLIVSGLQNLYAQGCGIITTIAGNGIGGYTGEGIPATAEELSGPNGVAVDAAGNVYIANSADQRVMKINTLGIISTIAGTGTSGFSGDGGAATAAELGSPGWVAVDAPGNVYITDGGNSRIRKVNTSGVISTIAGTGTGSYSGDGVAATASNISPYGVAIDAAGNVYIADFGNQRVRKVNTSGIISTIAGNGTLGYTGDGIAATDAELFDPTGVFVDGSGNVYIGDGANGRVRKVNTSGIISTIAGNGTTGYIGDGMAATASELGGPQGVAVDGSGNVYIADQDNAIIRKVNTSGIISTIAGIAITGGYSGDGMAATASRLWDPTGLAVDGSGNVYIGDLMNDRVRKVSSSSTLAVSVITGTTTVCAGTNTTLSDTVTGGAWSSSNTSIATVGSTGVVYGVMVGTDTIIYTVTNACGTATANKIITVNPLPVAGAITGTLTVCPASTITLSDVAGSGTWSSVTTGVATIGATGVATGVAAGTSVISYTVTNSCGTMAATAVVTVNPLPDAGAISGGPGVCPDSLITLTDPVTGGTWSSVTTGVATIGATGVVTGVAAGTSVISYTVTNSCGTAAATAVVTVNPLPDVSAISGGPGVCPDSLITLTDPVTGGAWISVTTGVATIGATGVVTGVAAGTSVISYTVTNSCGTAAATAVVTVNPLPDAGAISGGSGVCPDSLITLTDPVTGGAWSSSSSGTATVNSGGIVTSVATGSVTISYSVTGSCGTATAFAVITVNSTPDPGTITGIDTVCAGNSITLTDPAGGGIWSSGNSSMATVTTTGIVDGVSVGAVSISYSVTNSCGTIPAIFTVNVLSVAECIALNVAAPVNSANSEVKVYPNPNNGSFTLSYHLNNNPNALIEIMDVSGRIVYTTDIPGTEGKQNISISGLSNGIYYWEVLADNELLDKGKIAVIK